MCTGLLNNVHADSTLYFSFVSINTHTDEQSAVGSRQSAVTQQGVSE